MWKVIICFGPFLGKIRLMFKNTVGTGISAHCLKKWVLVSGPSLLQHKDGQLGRESNVQKFRCEPFLTRKFAETPIL